VWRPLGTSIQKVSAPDGPSPRPTISLLVSLGCDSDDRGHRDDPVSLAGFGVCGVQSDVGPLTGDRAVAIGFHDRPRNRPDNAAKKIAAVLLGQKLEKVHLGH